MTRIAARTCVGHLRELNEDAFAITVLGSAAKHLCAGAVEMDVASSCIFAVFDGCGGAGPGNVASDLAANHVHRALADGPEPKTSKELGDRLRAAVSAAGQAVFQRSQDDPAQRGMVTTATVAAILGQELQIANVGDGRAYLFRSNRLSQLTRDDTLRNALLDAGELREDDEATFDLGDRVILALGSRATVEVRISSLILEEGDTVLLCTDGVHRMIDDRAIEATLRCNPDPSAACAALISAAEVAGGHDNETVIVAKYQEARKGPPLV